MTNAVELAAIGRAVMLHAHMLILLGGLLGVLSIVAGLLSRRIGAPVLLTFLVLGMLAGQDGVLHIRFENFAAAYLIGSVALAVILFNGGLRTSPAVLRRAFWPALALATLGVAITALVFGGIVAAAMGNVSLPGALLGGAAVAPTDAAAVAVLLTGARIALPERLSSLLEVESGLNDPMSVFLTLLLIHIIIDPASLGFWVAILSFLREMVGGAVLGLAGGAALALALKRLRLEPALATVLVLTGALLLFGVAQALGTSGFLAIYIAGVMTGAARHAARRDVAEFLAGMAWLAQIVLFLMLGLLVTPHKLPPHLAAAIIGAAVLIFLARPVAVFACLLPFRFNLRETLFASWVGLRGAVPIYLSIIPALADPVRDESLFASIFIVVIASLLVQGWTIAPAARLLGFRQVNQNPPLGSTT